MTVIDLERINQAMIDLKYLKNLGIAAKSLQAIIAAYKNRTKKADVTGCKQKYTA